MNKHAIPSIAFGALLAMFSVVIQAEELTGTLVGAQPQAEALSSVATEQPSDVKKQLMDVKKQLGANMDVPSVPHSSDVNQRTHFVSHHFNEEILIPIISVIVIFGGGFVFILTLVRLRYKAKADHRLQRQDQIQRFIDSGRDVPNELLRDVNAIDDEANLAKGVKDTLVGLALMVFLTVFLGFGIGAVGLIVVAIGLSRLIIWKLSQSKKSQH